MRKTILIAAAVGVLAGASLLTAQTAQAQRASCFREAMQFDHAVTAMGGNLAQEIANPSPKLKEATDLRNQGVEACQQGRRQEGVQMIQQAIATLKG
jgi:nitrogen-specific signal transduction histidine kinase